MVLVEHRQLILRRKLASMKLSEGRTILISNQEACTNSFATFSSGLEKSN